MTNEDFDFANAEMLRKKAEEKLIENQGIVNKPVIEADVKKLLHELQVHQIELEMQNEELIRANATAEAALRKYTLLYDLAPMGYFTLDNQGSICELNFSGAEMLGDRRISLINSNFKLFIASDYKGMFNEFFKKVYSSKSKECCELMLGYDNNPLCFVYMEGIVINENQECLLSVINVSDFKK